MDILYNFNEAPPPFCDINSVEDIELAVTNLTKLVHNTLKVSKCHPVPQNYEILTRDIKIKINLINRLRRLWQISRDRSIRTNMIRINNSIKHNIRNFKNNKCTEFITSLTPMVYSIWNYLIGVSKLFTLIPSFNTDTGHKYLKTKKSVGTCRPI